MAIYRHTLRYSDLANARPIFQSHLEIVGADPNLNRTLKRYYSSQDASIFFGDFFVDDINNIEFEVTESAMLLYGYNSYVFDDVAKGARMVQGRFSINFTQANYLSKVLSDISVHKGTGAITHSRYHALWPVGFDVFVHYGDAESNDLEMISLQEIYITGCTLQTDARTGQPIEEIYTFIGKDIQFGPSLDIEDLPTQSEPEIECKASISSFSNEITFTFNQKLAIKKAAYDFNKHNLFTVKNITVFEDSLVIYPSIDQVKEWEPDRVYIDVKLYLKDAIEPLEFSTLLLRK